MAIQLQKSIEKDDLLTRMRIREVLLFGLIVMAAILAQLPHEILEERGINRNYLLGVLGCGIILGLFFYLRFFFFLAVVLLILGANLDQQISEYIEISKIPLVLALVAMVGISLINYVVKLMPTGLNTFRRSPLQLGHSVSASSEKDCCTSNSCPQSRQR